MLIGDEKLLLLRKKLSKIKDEKDIIKMYDFVSYAFSLQKMAEKERNNAREKRKRLLLMKKDYIEGYQKFMDGMDEMKIARDKHSKDDDGIRILSELMEARKEDLSLLSPFVDKAFYYTKKLAKTDINLSVPREDMDGETHYSEYFLDVAAKPIFQTSRGESGHYHREQLRLNPNGMGGLKEATDEFVEGMEKIVKDKNAGIDKITMGINGGEEVVLAEKKK